MRFEPISSTKYAWDTAPTTPAAGTATTSFTCGLNPTIAIANQTPINNLIVSETFTAGDFPVKILELSGNNPYTGKGYIIVLYLADTKIAVAFNNITVNTNYQLIKGVVETTYNPEAPNVVEQDPLIVEVFGPQGGGQDVGVVSVNESETSGTTTEVNSGNNISSSSNVGNISTTGENQSSNSNTNSEGTTNETSNPTNETASGNTNQNSTGTNVTGKDYYIEYEDKKYYTGGKIKIPYKRSMYETFEMKNLEKGTKVNFTIHEPGKETLWRGYDATTAKQSLPIEDNTPNLINLLKFDLVANAFELEKKPSVRIEIEKTLKPFVFTKLEAIDLSNTKRIAGEGETLYYVNKPTVTTEVKNTEFRITNTPNLMINEIPIENVKWKLNNIDYTSGKGILSFSKYINEKKDVKVTAITGFPNSSSKDVNVKWINENRGDASFMPPAVSSQITQFNDKLLLPFKKVSDKINDFFGTDKFKIEIKPLKIKGENYNDIDLNSRHYFKVLKGSINGGLSLKGEFLGYPPFLKILNIEDVSKVGVFASPKVEVNLIGGSLKKTVGETNNVFNDEFYFEGNLKGCLELGLKAELLVAKDLVDFSVNGFGEGCGSGKVVYDITSNEFKGGFYFDPIKLGVKAKIKSKGGISFTLVDVDKTWAITDKITLYE
ncbi:hypothetical protein [Flavobacterium davisii]|uniref:hypothetical protein n=1 Tax=Flavobacterium davisii TaxID=2906077 RepID=UPI0035CF8357